MMRGSFSVWIVILTIFIQQHYWTNSHLSVVTVVVAFVPFFPGRRRSNCISTLHAAADAARRKPKKESTVSENDSNNMVAGHEEESQTKSVQHDFTEFDSENILLSQVLEDILFQQDSSLDDGTTNHLDDFDTHRGHDNNDSEDPKREQTTTRKARHSQQKSKRYAMVQDVAKLVKQSDPRSIDKAQQVTERLLEMGKQNEQGGDDKPLMQAYNLWLHAISKTAPESERGKLAEDVLTQMKSHCRPTVVSYTICMMANQDSPPDAERLLFELLERQQSVDSSLVITSSITTDAVLQAWAQQGTWEAAERARLILERLEQWQASSSQNAVEANSHTYSIVMNAYSKLGAVEQVEAMLAKRIEDDERLGETKVDTVMYNVAIKAWAVSQDARAGGRATALLQELQQLRKMQPDIITYNSVLSAWSKSSGHINAAPQAERILQEMIINSKANPVAPRPNTVSYNTVLHAWSKSTKPIAVQRASAILEYMIRSQEPEPDIYSFTSVLNVLAKSKQPDKAIQASQLLGTLVKLSEQRQDLEPSNIAFNTVLNACAFSASFDEATRRQALQVAFTTFSQLRSSPGICRPDDITYGNLIKAIANLLHDNRTKRQQLAIAVMRQCMDDGLVGDMVWQELPRCLTKKALYQLLPKALQDRDTVALLDLPRTWRRHVKTKRKVKDPTATAKKSTSQNRRTQRRVIKGPRGISEASWASGKDM